MLSFAPVNAEDYKIVTCPRNRSYCTQEIRPIVSPEEAEFRERGGSTVTYSRAAEERKVHSHEDPGSISLCSSPRTMTRDGCQ